MSSGKKKQSTNNSIDPWSQQQYQGQQSRIRGILDGGYTGSLGASELSGYEREGGDLINQFVGSYGEGLDGARTAINDIDFTPRTFADFDADTYVNPYASELISQTSGDIQEAADRTRNGIKSENLAQGAYGGSRHGVREALLDESTLDSIADMSARTRFDVWNQGADRFYQDVGNEFQADALGLQRGGMLADLVGQEREFEQQDIDRLMGLGERERSVEDRYAAREYDEYWRRLQAEMGLLGSVPIIQDGESTSTYRPGTLDYVNSAANIANLFM